MEKARHGGPSLCSALAGGGNGEVVEVEAKAEESRPRRHLGEGKEGRDAAIHPVFVRPDAPSLPSAIQR